VKTTKTQLKNNKQQLKNNYKTTTEWKIVDENTLEWRNISQMFDERAPIILCIRPVLSCHLSQKPKSIVVFQLYVNCISGPSKKNSPCHRVGAIWPRKITLPYHTKVPRRRPHIQSWLMNFQVSKVLKLYLPVLNDYNVQSGWS
jgi:hypothetical protein